MHFDEILSKFWFLKANKALGVKFEDYQWVDKILNVIWSYIVDFYFFLMTDILTKDQNFIHLTPFICSRPS